MNDIKPHLAVHIQSKEPVYHPESINNSLSFVIVIAQFFGLMPLYGIKGKDYRKVEFRWKSPRFLYTIFNLSGCFVCAVFCCAQFVMAGLVLDKTAPLSFYICNFFGALYLVRVAKNWNDLMREWVKVEISMTNYGFPPNLSNRFKITTSIILVFALVEHLLFILNALHAMWKCQYQSAEIYFGFAFPHVFAVIPYTHWKAVLAEIINIVATFCWNFLDLFIILISSAVALRFQQVCKKINSNRVMYELFWRKIREDYNRLSLLCALIDKEIGPLVTVSYISNLFFICIQLYNSLKPRYGVIPTVYFFFSFGFLLIRTFAVSIYAAWINDESRLPLANLHSVPSEYYCTEVERLILQIHTNPVGITGSRFFLISRSFMLKVAGTIVTFELMLLQFGPLIHEELKEKLLYPEANVKNCPSNF